MRALAALTRPLRPALDLLIPPTCPSCHVRVDRPHALCPACWSRLRLIGAWRCRSCGIPFELDAGDPMICAGCSADPPPWDRARAAVVYDEGARDLILAFKHGDRTDLAPTLARMMAGAAPDLLDAADLVAPVPLHWMRLAARGFNQAALLSARLAALAETPHAPTALKRRKRTEKLVAVSAANRRRRLAGAILPRSGLALEGRRVLLIDDVMTSGATLAACARALKNAGAGAVDALCFARALR